MSRIAASLVDSVVGGAGTPAVGTDVAGGLKRVVHQPSPQRARMMAQPAAAALVFFFGWTIWT